MLSELNPDKVCFIIAKARSPKLANMTSRTSRPTPKMGLMRPMPISRALSPNTMPDQCVQNCGNSLARWMDEHHELVALCWLGRGDFDMAEWQEAIDEAEQYAETPSPIIFWACDCSPIISERG